MSHSLPPHPEHICKAFMGFVRDRVSDVQNWTSKSAEKFTTRRAKVQEKPREDLLGLRKQQHIQMKQDKRSDSAMSLHHRVGLGATTRDDLGRATWLLLHTLAAQYPEKPSKQQKSDAAALIDVLTRLYPCGECAEHFRQIVRDHKPELRSGTDLQQWMCEVHNSVNASLGKPSFNCSLVQARWGALDCGSDMVCDLTARHP